SDTSVAPSRAPSRSAVAASSWPMAAPSSSTRLATSRSSCSRSCCACCRSTRSSASAGRARSEAEWPGGGGRTGRSGARAAAGTFRSDLYYRLDVFPIVLPSLRDRPEDIPDLVRSCVQRFARRLGKRIESIPADALAALRRYDWPGNVRELENTIERAVIL